MTDQPTAPPVLSTPDTHIFEDPTPLPTTHQAPRLSDHDIFEIYEVSRTAKEIQQGGWRRIALQFPDSMLHDAPRVFDALEAQLKTISQEIPPNESKEDPLNAIETNFTRLSTSHTQAQRVRLYILADTSYGACCVDEIAAEHADADVVVHYGRSCLSPTARLPVIYVFTTRSLLLPPLLSAFENVYPSKEATIVLMADITYHSHIPTVVAALRDAGYTRLVAPEVVRDPASPIPNRLVNIDLDLKEYSLFHISDPPPSLLLTLSSRVKDMYIYPTTNADGVPAAALEAQTSRILRRRYAILTSLSTCPIFGILINTLSVKNYLPVIETLKSQIAAAGKKSYTFVVGKVNAAKVANFSEIGGWVVVGCWESALIESTEFYRPIITPFELGLALMKDEERLWSGEWKSDFSDILNNPPQMLPVAGEVYPDHTVQPRKEHEHIEIIADEEDEEESAPPEFDLRTGRYVSHSRPMRKNVVRSAPIADTGGDTIASQVLTRRVKGELTTVNGTVSPGAEYLKSQRTWQGLGSDFHQEDGSSLIEEGRSGVARGYTVGTEGERR